MIRFVISPLRDVVFDVNEKLPGAGIWLYPTKESLNTALNKRLFFKAAKGTVNVPIDLEDQILAALTSKIEQLVCFARKSGNLVFGYEAVKKALEAKKVFVAFEADDASKGGHDKLYRPTDDFPVCNYFKREELGRISGQDFQVHMAVTDEKIAQILKQTIKKINLLKGV